MSVNFFVSIELKAFTVPSHVSILGYVLDPPDGIISDNALVPFPASTEFIVLLVFPVPPLDTKTGISNANTPVLRTNPVPAVYV